MYKKLLILFVVFVFVFAFCKFLSYNYNFTEHVAYIYKYNTNNSITYKTTNALYFKVNFDSITYNKYKTLEYRNNYFKLKKFDDGRIYIISDNYNNN